MIYYAHSKTENIDAQDYATHINGVLDLVRQYFNEMDGFIKLDKDDFKQVAEKAAYYHDLGKLDPDNQKVLSGEESAKRLPISHEDAGCAYLHENSHCSVPAALAVFAHHAGYPELPEEFIKEERAFRNKNVMQKVDASLPVYADIHHSLTKNEFNYYTENLAGNRSVFLRMLLSCLADADHTDTARNYGNYPLREKRCHLRPTERLAQLNKKIAELASKVKEVDERFILRNQMYTSCRDARLTASISSCDSPVGSGKTTAVMAHLLTQAQSRGLRRIFIVLPFTNIIKQSVDIYRKFLTLPGESSNDIVAELHHRADFQSKQARHLTALWRAPIIVTTAVAFFETLASNKPSTLRRLHELPGSAVFVDESHAALPVKLLPITWKWIRVLAQEWSCYWVMASGSLTRYWTIPEITGKDCDFSVPEIVDENLRRGLLKYERDRITYCYKQNPMSTSELAEWIMTFSGPRLVILNTIQSAAMLANYLEKQFDRSKVEHLSTALTPNDREKTLENIKKRLKNVHDDDWTLVATSCIEAGVDISFRNGFREVGSLLSLLQASGRVDREGKYKNSEMWSFSIKEDGKLLTNPGMNESSRILKYYFENDFTIEPSLSTDSIIKEIRAYGNGAEIDKIIEQENNFRFVSVKDNYCVIDTKNQTVIVNEALIQKIRFGKVDWREIQKFAVQIPIYKLTEYRTPIIIDELYGWNLEYNEFLGYMAGVIEYIKAKHDILIDDNY